MKWIILLITLLFLIAGCVTQSEAVDTTPTAPASHGDKRTTQGIMYISASQKTCSTIQYICENEMIPFFDATGCGCEPVDSGRPKVKVPAVEEVQVKEIVEDVTEVEVVEGVQAGAVSTECAPEDRDVDACIKIDQPVCGWSDESIQCLTYPCASTYQNSCFACQNEEVAHWTSGECPAPGSPSQ